MIEGRAMPYSPLSFLLVSDVMHDLSMFEGLTLRAGPRMATLHPGLEARILCDGIEAGAVLVDVGQVAVAEDAGIGMYFLQTSQQAQQGTFLLRRAGVSRFSVLVESAFVADTQRMAVEACGVGSDQLLVARLVGRAIAGDVVMVARESESFRVTADEGCHGKVLVRARCRTVYHNQINMPHDCTKNELTIAVSTVMMNWMTVFHVLRSFRIFIII